MASISRLARAARSVSPHPWACSSSSVSVFNLLGVSVWYQQLLKGAIILLGAAAYVGRRELAVNEQRPDDPTAKG
jgi:hypothetical protein